MTTETRQKEKILLMPVEQGADGEVRPVPGTSVLMDASQIYRTPFNFGVFYPWLLAAVLGLLIVSAWFLLAVLNPVTILISPTFSQEVTYKATVGPESLYSRQTSFTVALPALATGSQTIADVAARGEIRFLSLASGSVYLPAGTVIFSQKDIKYKLLDTVTIPGYGGKVGEAGGIIVADTPGPGGNLPNGIGAFIFTGGIRVQGVGGVLGGTTKTVKIVSDEDITNLRTDLDAAAKDGAGVAVRTATPDEMKLSPNYAITFTDYALPAVGSELANQRGSVKVLVNFTIYDPLELLRLYALPVESQALGQPEFKGINLITRTMSYSRPVNRAVYLSQFNNWQGSLPYARNILLGLASSPGVTDTGAPALPFGLRAFRVKIEVG